MERFRKKPVVVEAVQWFRNGDHPDDDSHTIEGSDGPFLSEGQVVRRFRRPDVGGSKPCGTCGKVMYDHGWIDTLEGGHVVCPGDWIITGVKGERYPCKPDIFKATYEPVDVHTEERKVMEDLMHWAIMTVLEGPTAKLRSWECIMRDGDAPTEITNAWALLRGGEESA